MTRSISHAQQEKNSGMAQERPSRSRRACGRMGRRARSRTGCRRGRKDSCSGRGRGWRRCHGRALGDDGRRRPFHAQHQGRRRTHPHPGRNRLAARLLARRRIAQRQFRHPRHHQLGDGLLRAVADAGDRLRPAGPVDDDVACAISLRTTSKSRSTASPRSALATISTPFRCRRSWACSRPRSGRISAW